MNRYICIHGHFYQPPRENPWLEEVEMQDSAYPYHDWNERITAECYAPNTASRLLEPGGRIIDIVNNYSKISFNFGPTLLSWMERHSPDVHRAIVEADRQSRKNFSGHGSALAQVYNHMIMPLANARDKRTQVAWGVRDFEHRFGRRPEGMWLAETAVDLETLDIMAEHEILFTVLAPRQARRVKRMAGGRWRNVSDARVDPKMAYLCRLPSGRAINLFFYDGPISQDIAFGGLLTSGETFANRLLSAFSEDAGQPQLVHIATDGETYGHHHRHGDMALAYCLHHIESNELARLTVYGEHLERFPPTHEVEIIENTSWSCAHGVDRWHSHCGCNTGREGWAQEWRAPLREALDWLRDELVAVYEKEISPHVRDPWAARDDYIDVILNRSAENVEIFLSAVAARELSKEEKVKTLRLLEMQRHAMLMYTSCGWFFDEISGIETTQVLQYAARAMQLAVKAAGADFEPRFVELIRRAPSNVEENQNGAEVYARFVKPAAVDLLRVGAHYGVSSLFKQYEETETIYPYTAQRESYDVGEAGRQRLAIGRAHMRSNITWDEKTISFAVLHFGDHNLIGGVRDFKGDEDFALMREEIKGAFSRSDTPEIIRLMDKHFESHNYSLWHLFRDEQRAVFSRILESTLSEVQVSFRQVYEHNYQIMQVMRELHNPIPKALMTAAEFTINSGLRAALESEETDLEHLRGQIEEARKWGVELDRTTLGFVANRKIDSLMRRLSDTPEQIPLLKEAASLVGLLGPLNLALDLWKAQNVHFSIARQLRQPMRERAEAGDLEAAEWLEHFDSLGSHLGVRIA
jgi:alpha-amylase/alpha-mannosidase (GH57 family)